MNISDPLKQGSKFDLFWFFFIAIFVVVGLLGTIGAGAKYLSNSGAQGLAWMTLAGGGFIAIVIVMIVGAIIYRAMGAHDSQQALGMPKGSVRSLLMFLIFSLLGVFVFFSVDSINGDRVRSTITVPSGEDIYARIAQLGVNENIISIGPGEDIEQVSDNGVVMVTTTVAVFERKRPADQAVIDHINQIAIAIFSMASSIIGYYFGTRSQVPVTAQTNGRGAQPTPAQVPPGEHDSPDWSLGTTQIDLMQKDGAYVGELEFASDELAEDHAFDGQIVPPEDDRTKYEAFKVTVTRSGQSLLVQIIGPETPPLAEAQLSLYPVDHEDVALAVKMAT